jgi:seryl-tRNA synthetase
MNGADVKWLEKMFEQHKEDQQLYLDTKFDNLSEQIGEIKDTVEDVEVALIADIDNVEEDMKELEKKTNKKIVAGGAGAVLVTLTLWTIFGTDALAIVLRFLS